MAGLFDTFTIAKRGLSVQQSNINTSSHNIANASTDGYSRQRSVAHTTRPFGGMSRFDTCTVGQVGTGAEITQIMRIRDSFLDYQVRTENTNYGTANVKNDYLTQVEDILNETSDNGIQTYLSKFYDAFQNLSASGGAAKESNRTTAFKAAEQLSDLIRSKYSQIENKESDAQKELRDQTTSINSMLDQINNLGKEISGVCAVGMTPNDLMDSRDLLIDQLSTKFGVKIDKGPRETMDLSATEDPTVGNLVNSDPTDTNYTRFSYVESADFAQTGTNPDGSPIYDYTQLTVKYAVLGDTNNQKTITISDTDVNKMKDLQNNLIQDRMLVGNKDGIIVDASGTPITTANATDMDAKIFNNITKGEIAGAQQVEDSMQDYMSKLDKFAASFAYAVNAIQTGDRGIAGDQGILDKNGNKISAVNIFVTKNLNGTISTTDDGITAKNIIFNTVLEDHPEKLNCGKYSVDDYSGEADGSRALAIADVAKLKIDIGNLDIAGGDISTRQKFFQDTGLTFNSDNEDLVANKDGSTVGDYYGTVLSDIYSDNKKATQDVSDSKTLLDTFNTQRQSVSGVSLDEEMTDLVQFQHAYQANAKMINTIDQLLDVVINGLKS
ncbi:MULTISPECIES: flagellar hook-associated protein FlgK [unclassified Clostridium]|uniref:flagellar hook-associated protein FlgK n=1 Tax=unclassified Clostridium TaxID=2614128 RepID=UPI00029799D7|nr:MULTISPECIES: flagellar hook-associated protein FlgK [unclassified Clostridium]EKQ51145.1 MAG: flagellar hook-associated protein FlgK [Clostridium sp. Maddingley MBC34-26]